MDKLERMLKYVSKHNDFYKKRIAEYGIKNPLDITQYPVLTRRELQENRYNMFSDGYKSKYFNQQLRRQSSSGSTGIPVNVYWDYKDWYASNMCLWRRRLEWYGIKPSDKYCIFTLNAFGITPEEGKLYYINKPSNIMSFNVSLIQNENGYEQMANIINAFKPDWLYIQPFVLNQLIRAYKSINQEPPNTIKYIESVGEILTSDLRRRAEESFHVKIVNMYGSEEMNGIALECPNRHMHLLTDNVFVEYISELKTDESKENMAYITNLNNYAMPLIRYEQGDLIKLDAPNSECVFDEKAPIIQAIKGRLLTLTTNNKKINTIFLLELISEANNQFDDIVIDYKYILTEDAQKIQCMILIKEGYSAWFPELKKHIENTFYAQNASCEDIIFEVVCFSDRNVNNKKNIIEIRR